MFQWIQGRPAVLLSSSDLGTWPGGVMPPARGTVVRRVAGHSVLVMGGASLTAAVPLELGGLLLVGAVYCDSDESLSSHLDMTPTVGWELAAERFVSDGTGHLLIDGGRAGARKAVPDAQVEVALDAGSYDVEVLGPWSPDDRTEVWLTRLVRAAPSAP